MAQLTYEQYSRLESAVSRGLRVIVHRRGTEYVIVPLGLVMRQGREVIEARNPTTGDSMSLFIDELDSVELL
jgi:hypothetical protein